MKELWNRWKRFAKKVGDVQARFILTVLYFVLIAPFALIVRWAADPLSIKPNVHRGWPVKDEVNGSPQ